MLLHLVLWLGGAVTTVEAKYTRPYQCHASIGPSCAVAQIKEGKLTVWTHSINGLAESDFVFAAKADQRL